MEIFVVSADFSFFFSLGVIEAVYSATVTMVLTVMFVFLVEFEYLDTFFTWI